MNAPLPDPTLPPFSPASLPPRPRIGRHLGLVVACFLTLCFAGGLIWNPSPALVEIETLRQLFSWSSLSQILLSGVGYAIWVLAILGAHEFGHYFACRYYGIPATLPFFIPGVPYLGTFGAVIRIRGRIPDRRALFDVAAAGPIAGFVVAAPVFLAGLAIAEPAPPDLAPGGPVFGAPVLWTLVRWFSGETGSILINPLIGAGWVGLLVTSLNLFPVGQLDGGHAAYAFSPRIHRLLAWGTIASMIGLIAYQAVSQRSVPAYALWFLILLWMRDRHPPLIDETSRIGFGRRCVGFALLLLFVLSFIPTPIRLG